MDIGTAGDTGAPGLEVPQVGTARKADLPDISEHLEAWLDDHLASIRAQIIKEARYLAKKSERERLEPLDVAEAARQFAPGKRFPGEPKFWQRIGSSISAITLVSAILAVLFGTIGALLNHRTPEIQAGSPSGYFDIAKLFAGAVVGSSGANLAAAFRKE